MCRRNKFGYCQYGNMQANTLDNLELHLKPKKHMNVKNVNLYQSTYISGIKDVPLAKFVI